MSRWRYDKEFELEFTRVKGKIRIAFETIQPYDDDDPLHGIFAWLRLVIWTDAEGHQTPHVNVSSDLRKLFGAPLQTFSDAQTGREFSLYLVDYDTPRFDFRDGQSRWEGEITPPKTFLEFLDREEHRRQIREGAGP